MSMPLLAFAGVMGRLLRDLATDKEYIWKITPFPELNLYRLLRKPDLRLPVFGISCVLVILLAELLRSTIAVNIQTRGVFALTKDWKDMNAWMVVAQYATTVFAVILPIKIWHSSRYEKLLEQQQLRLNEARLRRFPARLTRTSCSTR